MNFLSTLQTKLHRTLGIEHFEHRQEHTQYFLKNIRPEVSEFKLLVKRGQLYIIYTYDGNTKRSIAISLSKFETWMSEKGITSAKIDKSLVSSFLNYYLK